MPNIAVILKSEIARVARKEVRAQTANLKKTASAYRSEIAALKRRVQALEQELRRLGKIRAMPEPVEASQAPSQKVRFSAKSLASQRRRLALSADDYGLLLGASGQSVYNWESGKVRPKAQHMPAIVALRTMSKKEAAQRLASLRSPS